MEATCRRALEIGLPAIAFTEHADFVAVHEGQHGLDVAGYLESVDRCRARGDTGARYRANVSCRYVSGRVACGLRNAHVE